MARHNVIFGHDEAVRSGSSGPQFRQSGAPAQQQTQWSSGFGQQAPAGQQADPYGSDNLEALYASPSATGHDTGRMTMRDALNAITATLGVIVVVGFAVAVSPYALGLIAGDAGIQLGFTLTIGALVIGLIGGLVTGLVNAFKKRPSPALVIAYAVFEGLLLGGLSGMMEYVYPGIALQAVVATFAVAAAVLVLFRLGVLRTSPRLNKIFFVAMIAYAVFCLVSIGFSLFTGASLREGVIGLAIGGLAVVLASYSLVMDFEDVQRAAQSGVERRYAWRCAFGVAATLVWMYVEILRILAILRGN